MVRLFAEGDSVARLTRLLHRAYSGHAAEGRVFFASYQSVEDTAYRLSRGECWLALRAGELVGTVTVAAPHGAPEGYPAPAGFGSFWQLAVDPSYQGMGLGQRLLALAEERIAELGSSQVVIDTSVEAVDLVGWYRRRGYRAVGSWRWGVTNYESVVLLKELTPGGRGGDTDCRCRTRRHRQPALLAEHADGVLGGDDEGLVEGLSARSAGAGDGALAARSAADRTRGRDEDAAGLGTGVVEAAGDRGGQEGLAAKLGCSAGAPRRRAGASREHGTLRYPHLRRKSPPVGGSSRCRILPLPSAGKPIRHPLGSHEKRQCADLVTGWLLYGTWSSGPSEGEVPTPDRFHCSTG
ncbi:N-acetyltransferase [Streptomyces bacillaris]|uniref:GNAT family N-acetyltransferase n=1 Tax=Streptomyces bacillaris TaxID=68179 RepID=UPI00334750AF